MFESMEQVLEHTGIMAHDCHPELPRDNEYHGLGLKGGAVSVEEALFLAGLIWVTRPHHVIELGTSQGGSSVFLAAALKDLNYFAGYGKTFYNMVTVDLAETPPEQARHIADSMQLPLTFVNKTNSLDYLKNLNIEENKKYFIFSDTDIPVRPEEVKIIVERFPKGTVVAVHDTSPKHPAGPMRLQTKLVEAFKIKSPLVVDLPSPRGISVLTT